MQEKAAALGAVAMKGADVPPMALSIVLPEGDGVDVSVQISLSGAAAALPLVKEQKEERGTRGGTHYLYSNTPRGLRFRTQHLDGKIDCMAGTSTHT